MLSFLLRGGSWWSGTKAGVSAFGGGNGSAIYNSGFRPVVAVLQYFEKTIYKKIIHRLKYFEERLIDNLKNL